MINANINKAVFIFLFLTNNDIGTKLTPITMNNISTNSYNNQQNILLQE